MAGPIHHSSSDSLSLSLTLILSHTHTLSLSLFLTHTKTLTPSPSLSPPASLSERGVERYPIHPMAILQRRIPHVQLHPSPPHSERKKRSRKQELQSPGRAGRVRVDPRLDGYPADVGIQRRVEKRPLLLGRVQGEGPRSDAALGNPAAAEVWG